MTKALKCCATHVVGNAKQSPKALVLDGKTNRKQLVHSYIYIYTYIYTYIYIHTYIHIYIHTHICPCMTLST